MLLKLMRFYLSRIFRIAAWLTLPLAALLFLQWPLREGLHAYSREANDAAQWIFALYVSVAVSAATSKRSHLGVHSSESIHSRLYVIIKQYTSAIALFLWGGYVLWVILPTLWQSLMQLERFSETLNPGYFIIKLAAALLALLIMLQAVLNLTPNASK